MKNIKSYIAGSLATLAMISTLSFVLPDDILGKAKNKKQLLAENEELTIQLSKNTELLDKCQFEQGLQNKLLLNRIDKIVLERDQTKEKEFLIQLQEANAQTRKFRNWMNQVKTEIQKSNDSLSYGQPYGFTYISKADVQHRLFDSLYYEGPRAYHLENKADSIASLLNETSEQLGYISYKYSHHPIVSVAPSNQNYSANELKGKEQGLIINKLTSLQNELFLQEAKIINGFDQYLINNPIKKEVKLQDFSFSGSTKGKPFYFDNRNLFSLYLNCANPLSLQLLGDKMGTVAYNSSGGALRKGKKAGDVIVYPNSKQVKITVSNNGANLGAQAFAVKKIPLPTIEVRPNGKKMTASQERVGLSAPPRSISVVAIPDAGFKSVLPSEAKYKVTKWTVTLVRGKRPVGPTMTFSSKTGNVSSLREKVKPGDRILVEVKNVIRKNSLGKAEGVKIGLVMKNILF